MVERLQHRRISMRGRDPHEQGRAATPLELFFDLTFVIAFGTAADELAHALAEDHVGDGLLGFAFATFAVSWAWINFSWFASAYDTDDWVYRLTTMVQMVGVLVLALGLPDMFESLREGDHVDNTVMVLGYVIMRVPMIAQWLRASRQDPGRRQICLTMATALAAAQIGWIALLIADLTVVPMFACAAVLIVIELAGPVRAERIDDGTPWHPHHIAERYGLLVIITLGEGMIGTMATLTALVGPEGPGWSDDVVLLGVGGVALTFGLWWSYFVVPWGSFLHARPERSFGWGYWHMLVFGALVAVGAGLHVAAYYLEHHSELGTAATLLSVAVPVAIFLGMVFALYSLATRAWDPLHTLLVAVTAAILVVSVVVAASGSLVWGLVVLSLSPWVTVVGYELRGHRHNAEMLAELEASAGS